ncbi:mitochondrial 37S ribosomal protein uS9m [Dipodascopsis tothii]|uniref:mitochondrial 37S ribosomal protein uS9m n=1 Tax=Dipodascopsis tothii TaxID=44089 RepID=UPI0034CF56D2
MEWTASLSARLARLAIGQAIRQTPRSGVRMMSSSAVRAADKTAVPVRPAFLPRQTAEEVAELTRRVPVSPSYFTLKPEHNDLMIYLNSLVSKYSALPTVTREHYGNITFISKEEFLSQAKRKSKDYTDFLKVINRLLCIDPQLRPEEVDKVLQQYVSIQKLEDRLARQRKVDKLGRAYGTGRRKNATAQVWLVAGEGKVLVNGKSLAERFGRIDKREAAVWPLKVVQAETAFNVFAVCHGGGTTGQAEAIALGISKALRAYNPFLISRLRKAGCLKQDRRVVERKKPGKLKARKSPQWVKR